MGRNRFVDPTATVRLELSDGDWIEARESISWGADLKMLGLSAAAQSQDPRLGLAASWDLYKMEELMAWIVDWSFTDTQGRKVEFSREALADLHPDTGREISEALARHQDAQRELPKATTGGKLSVVASS